jgi:peptide/nickel transport system ATP-binding protein
MLPQNPGSSLTPTMRVGRHLAEVLTTHGRASDGGAIRRTSIDLLGEVHLPNPGTALRRYPHQFSGGQQQRIALALALAPQPSILVLDEPTTGLDVTTQARILELLAEVRRSRSTAMLYVSHDLGSLAKLCDRIAIMRHGRLHEIAPTGRLFAAPEAPYTRELLDSLPSLSRPPRASGLRRTTDRPAPTPAAALEVDRLLVRHGPGPGILNRNPAPPVVRGVSFRIEPGETFALVGESGSGKTTIARVVAGLWRPTEGAVRWGGKDLAPGIRRRTPEERRLIQLVYQNPDGSLNRRHRVGTIIGRPLSVFFGMDRAARRRRVAELLADVRLDPSYADRFPAQLSGGERQRVAIARALAAEPSLILCDEVLSALDVSVQAGIIELLQELQQRRGLSCLFISHDLAVVRWLARRVGVLHQGALCEVGRVEEIFARPQHPYTRTLLAAVADVPSSPPRQP